MNTIKPIRSFVKRQRRLSLAKQKTLEETWKIYGLDSSEPISFEKTFARKAPTTLEIGFGTGTTLFDLAHKYPEQNFIGVEVYQKGILTLLTKLKAHPLNNIRIYNEDAVTVLKQCVSNNSLEKVLIFFPDPWPKKRHHKRRLIQTEFIELIQRKLKTRGLLHIATDWENYAEHIITVLQNNPNFTPLKSPTCPADRIITKFEQRGKKAGHKIFDLLYCHQLKN